MRKGTRLFVGVVGVVAGGLLANGLVPAVGQAGPPAPWASRINTGGSAVQDGNGVTWSADTAFTGGTATFTTSPIAAALDSSATTAAVAAGSTDQSIYQDERAGMSSYAVPVPAPGAYGLRLHMAETSIAASTHRVFSVSAEGRAIVSDLDIFASVRSNRAYVRQATVAGADGTLDLAFTASSGETTVAGIEVWALTTAGPVPTTTTAVASTTTTTTAPATTTTSTVPTTTTPTSTSTTTSTTTTTTTTTPASPARWVPAVGTTWQWQLTSSVDQAVNVAVYDIDGLTNSAAVVSPLHAAGRKVICYVEVGGWENYRPDAASFPAVVLGNGVDGWPDERWLDIRRLDILGPLMAARFDQCKAKGFDAVEPDLLDGFTNPTGFPLTADDQLRFNRYMAALAHDRGMSIALKNDPDQASELVGDFDFAVVEECARYDECAAYAPFITAGKAVLHVEYALETSQFCPTTVPLGFSSMKKLLSLDAYRVAC